MSQPRVVVRCAALRRLCRATQLSFYYSNIQKIIFRLCTLRDVLYVIKMSVNLKKKNASIRDKKTLVTYINRKMICKIKLRNILLSSKPCFYVGRLACVRTYVVEPVTFPLFTCWAHVSYRVTVLSGLCLIVWQVNCSEVVK